MRPMKRLIGIVSILIGMVIGPAGLFFMIYGYPGQTEVWTAKTDLRFDDGILIPAGTEFVHHRWMPEGFATTKLYLNIEGQALEAFVGVGSHTIM